MKNEIATISSGIQCLSGFVYQMKVFIYLYTQLQSGGQIEFETLDDITTKDFMTNTEQYEKIILSQKDDAAKITVFQVKQTNIDVETCRKILYNWLLAYHRNPNISDFWTYQDDGYSSNMTPFNNQAQAEYDAIMGSTKRKNALVAQVKEKYIGNFEQFEKDYQFICTHYSHKVLKNIDEHLVEALYVPLHLGATNIGPVYRDERVHEFINKIYAQILAAVEKKIPYISSVPEYLKICEDVCNNISPDQFRPDYQAFKALHTFDDISDKIKATRVYRQLAYCDLPKSSLINHLQWEQYYRNIRQSYLQDAQDQKIASIEDIAFQNHSDVVLELQSDGRDMPRMRLVKTKDKTISVLSDEYSRWGAYVFLTNDDASNQISWKDEDNGEQ